MIDKKEIKVFIYIRVSTQEQAKEGYSIGAQEERLRAYAKARGYTIVKVYSDPGFSGSNLDRPALQEMISGIKKGYVDMVVVYKLDRISRSQKDTLYLIEDVFLKNNVDFVSMNESFDTSTPFGRAMIGILSVFAQLEREQIRERSIMGKEERAKEGKWHGGGGDERIVTGYDYVDGLLYINDYEAASVRYMFELYNKGDGVGKAFTAVTEKFPGVIFSETTVRKILANPIYIGKIRYKGEIYEGIHEPIIDEKTFYNTQELIKKRSSTTDIFRQQYLLSGLMYCEHCGARMFGRTGGSLKSGTSMRYYVCYSRQKHRPHMIKDPDCIKTSERKEKLEQTIIEEINKLNVSDLEKPKENNAHDRLIKTLNKEKENIENQISKLLDLYSVKGMPIEEIGKKIEKLNSEKIKLEEHITDLKEEENNKDIKEIKKVVSTLSEFDWDNEDTKTKRLLVAKLINKITVSNDNLTIEWAF